jgi:AcrR family transcriptional regulator
LPAQRNAGATKARAASPDDSTRERVMRAATSLFAERGFNGTGIRDIATAAELTTSTLYHYMSNKDDLLVEIMLATTQPLRDAATNIVEDLKDPAARLAAIVEAHVWAHASDRLPMLVADTELRSLSGERLKRVVRLRDDYEGIWKSVIRSGLKQDVFETAQPDLAARALLQMATGVSHWYSPGGSLQLEQLCHEHADWALAMLRARHAKRLIRCADLSLPAPSHYLTNAASKSQLK